MSQKFGHEVFYTRLRIFHGVILKFLRVNIFHNMSYLFYAIA